MNISTKQPCIRSGKQFYIPICEHTEREREKKGVKKEFEESKKEMEEH